MFAFPTQINSCCPVVRIFANTHNSCFNFGFHAFLSSSCACPRIRPRRFPLRSWGLYQGRSASGARTQNDLGSALARLGEREPGTARLEAAVTRCDGVSGSAQRANARARASGLGQDSDRSGECACTTRDTQRRKAPRFSSQKLILKVAISLPRPPVLLPPHMFAPALGEQLLCAATASHIP
jgi:hypothetical protein